MSDDFNSDLLRKIQEEGMNSTFFDNLLSTLLNTFPDHIYLKDTNSRFILINDSLAKLFHLNKPEEAIGKTDFDFFTKEHALSAYTMEQNIMKSREGQENFIEKETWPDGSISWAASTKVPFCDDKENVIGLFGISRDITVRKKIESELENRANELQCFINISHFAKKKDMSSENFILKINELIPKYLSHAHICSSRVIIGNKVFKNGKFEKTDFAKKFKIKENNNKIGILEIYSTVDIGRKPFKLPDETDQVLKLIADRISEIIEKKWIEKDLRKWDHIMKDAEAHMDLYP